MNALEQQVWAAAFAAEFAREWAFRAVHGRDPQKLSGFSCAEIADEAVKKLREAMTVEDSKYLLPAIEGLHAQTRLVTFKWVALGLAGYSSRAVVIANGIRYVADAYNDGSYSVDYGDGSDDHCHIADEDGRRSLEQARAAAEAWIIATASV